MTTASRSKWLRNCHRCRGGVPTSVLLQNIFDLAPDEIEGNNDVLGRLIDGDFVLRGAADDDHIRTGVEKVLSDTWVTDVPSTSRCRCQGVRPSRRWKYHPVDPAGTDPVLGGSATSSMASVNPMPRVPYLFGEHAEIFRKRHGHGGIDGINNGIIKDPKECQFPHAARPRPSTRRSSSKPMASPLNLNFSLDDDPSKPSTPKAVLDHITRLKPVLHGPRKPAIAPPVRGHRPEIEARSGKKNRGIFMLFSLRVTATIGSVEKF